MRKIHITRLATIAGVTGALAVATTAFAGEPNVTDPASLPKFENVRVVNVTPTAPRAASATQSSEGMRAYIDADTKRLRQANPEELAAGAVAKPFVAEPAAVQRSAAVSVESTAPAEKTLDNGAIAVMLDESSMSYSVAQVASDGTVKQECVEGKAKADAALKAKPVAASGVDRHEK